jgi:hypothetical protein
MRNQVVQIAGQPTPHALLAAKRTSTSGDSQNIGMGHHHKKSARISTRTDFC